LDVQVLVRTQTHVPDQHVSRIVTIDPVA